jgi:hypothetical protein
MGEIRTIQSWIQDLTLRLEQNPQNSNTVEVLEPLQESERALFAQVRNITSILNSTHEHEHEPEARLVPTAYVPYNHHRRDEEYFRENEGRDYDMIDSDDERYFHLPKSGRGLFRRKKHRGRR